MPYMYYVTVIRLKTMGNEQAEENTELSHVQAMSIFRRSLSGLIQNDPLLFDLPSDITLDEINAKIDLEHGQSMTVYIRRVDGVRYPIVLRHCATVHDLKQALRRCVQLRQKRHGGVTCISWQYVWRKYCLVYDGRPLTDGQKMLKDYGIRNKVEVVFRKRLQK